MKRAWIWLLGLVAIVAACRPPAYVPLYPPNEHVTPAPHVAPPLPPHTLLGYNASPSFYDNLKSLGYFYVTDPVFGAVGDNSHDDTAAIVAALAAAQAVNGVVVLPPASVAYKVTSEIPVNWPALITGVGGNSLLTTIVRASTSMRSVFALRTTNGAPNLENGLTRGVLRNFTVDANRLAYSAVLAMGDESSQLDHMRLINGVFAGYYESYLQFAMGLGAVSCAGTCGPATFAVTQPDINYYNSPTLTNTNVALKITTGGSLGTAQFEASFDNGATYQTTCPQTTAAVTSIALCDGNGHFTSPTGLRVAWNAGTYTNGDVYKFLPTYTAGDFGAATSTNGDVDHDTQDAAGNGSITATAGFSGPYGGYSFLNLVGGSVTVTAGSPIVAGTGTAFTATPGALTSRIVLRIPGAVAGGIAPQGIYFRVAAVLDDTHLALEANNTPTVTHTGVDFALLAGAGDYESGLEDTPADSFRSGHCTLNSVCYSLSGRQGDTFVRPVVISSGVGFSFDANVLGHTLIYPETDSAVQLDYLFNPNSNGEIHQPTFLTMDGIPVPWVLETNGKESPLIQTTGAINFLAMAPVTLVESVQSITSAGQQITLPNFTAPTYTGATTFVDLLPNGNYVLSATPTLPDPGFPGLVMVLRNNSLLNVLTFQNWLSGTNTGLQLEGADVSIGPNESITLISTGQTFPPWQQLNRVGYTYGNKNNHIQAIGNTGESRTHLITSNATPTSIIAIACNTSIGGGNGFDFDVMADSGAVSQGTNVAHWIHCFAEMDVSCNLLAYTCDSVSGTGAGSLPPLGWALTHDASGTNPFHFYVAGDTSGNSVFWTLVGRHRDPPLQ